VTFDKADVDAYLMALDQEIEFKFELIIIGGAALMLAYQAKTNTEDIDSFNSVARLAAAKDRLFARGFDVPLIEAKVRFGPYDFLSRAVSYSDLNLKHLRILVPEIHDLILFKLTRLEERDLKDILRAAATQTINPEILFSRFYIETYPGYAGDLIFLCEKYLNVVMKLWGDGCATEHEQRLNLKGVNTNY